MKKSRSTTHLLKKSIYNFGGSMATKISVEQLLHRRSNFVGVRGDKSVNQLVGHLGVKGATPTEYSKVVGFGA